MNVRKQILIILTVVTLLSGATACKRETEANGEPA